MVTKKTGAQLAGSKRPVATAKQGLTVVSLFAGAGGLDIAACRTGHVGRLFSTDSNKIFLQSVVDNLPNHFPQVRHSYAVSDVRELTTNIIWKLLGTKTVDLVMGGPPCDDFTTYGRKQGAKGNKAPLIFEYARLIAELKPKAFLFENVPNLARQFPDFFEKFMLALPRGYVAVKHGVLSAKNYGAPTMRERLFAVGFADEKLAARFQFPSPTHGETHAQLSMFESSSHLRAFTTVGEVLGDLPDVTDPRASKFLNHNGRTHRAATVEHLKTVLQGVAATKSYRYRAPWAGQCRSLTAGLDDSAKAYIHPTHHREMTVREYARIHGFPDSWAFAGKLDNGLKQVANSVPINLGFPVLEQIVLTLRKGKPL